MCFSQYVQLSFYLNGNKHITIVPGLNIATIVLVGNMISMNLQPGTEGSLKLFLAAR